MNPRIMELLSGAETGSFGRIAIVACHERSTFMGSEVAGMVHLRAEGREAHVVVAKVPAGATAKDALLAAKLERKTVQAAEKAGVEARLLVCAADIGDEAMDALGKSGVSSANLASGAMLLLLPGYTYQDRGGRRAYPETTGMDQLMAGRGEDLSRALMESPDDEWSITGLHNAARASTSVVHRFKAKLMDLGLAEETKGAAFRLSPSGKAGLAQTLRALDARHRATAVEAKKADSRSQSYTPSTDEIESTKAELEEGTKGYLQ